ncbi:RAC family serine/threonine-protein kinase-like protein [Diplonema papillatum]|nr:RAC family serine/threonine-protein kinase-like protein [Diplonema papillatum]
MSKEGSAGNRDLGHACADDSFPCRRGEQKPRGAELTRAGGAAVCPQTGSPDASGSSSPVSTFAFPGMATNSASHALSNSPTDTFTTRSRGSAVQSFSPGMPSSILSRRRRSDVTDMHHMNKPYKKATRLTAPSSCPPELPSSHASIETRARGSTVQRETTPSRSSLPSPAQHPHDERQQSLASSSTSARAPSSSASQPPCVSAPGLLREKSDKSDPIPIANGRRDARKLATNWTGTPIRQGPPESPVLSASSDFDSPPSELHASTSAATAFRVGKPVEAAADAAARKEAVPPTFPGRKPLARRHGPSWGDLGTSPNGGGKGEGGGVPSPEGASGASAVEASTDGLLDAGGQRAGGGGGAADASKSPEAHYQSAHTDSPLPDGLHASIAAAEALTERFASSPPKSPAFHYDHNESIAAAEALTERFASSPPKSPAFHHSPSADGLHASIAAAEALTERFISSPPKSPAFHCAHNDSIAAAEALTERLASSPPKSPAFHHSPSADGLHASIAAAEALTEKFASSPPKSPAFHHSPSADGLHASIAAAEALTEKFASSPPKSPVFHHPARTDSPPPDGLHASIAAAEALTERFALTPPKSPASQSSRNHNHLHHVHPPADLSALPETLAAATPPTSPASPDAEKGACACLQASMAAAAALTRKFDDNPGDSAAPGGHAAAEAANGGGSLEAAAAAAGGVLSPALSAASDADGLRPGVSSAPATFVLPHQRLPEQPATPGCRGGAKEAGEDGGHTDAASDADGLRPGVSSAPEAFVLPHQRLEQPAKPTSPLGGEAPGDAAWRAEAPQAFSPPHAAGASHAESPVLSASSGIDSPSIEPRASMDRPSAESSSLSTPERGPSYSPGAARGGGVLLPRHRSAVEVDVETASDDPLDDARSVQSGRRGSSSQPGGSELASGSSFDVSRPRGAAVIPRGHPIALYITPNSPSRPEGQARGPAVAWSPAYAHTGKAIGIIDFFFNKSVSASQPPAAPSPRQHSTAAASCLADNRTRSAPLAAQQEQADAAAPAAKSVHGSRQQQPLRGSNISAMEAYYGANGLDGSFSASVNSTSLPFACSSSSSIAVPADTPATRPSPPAQPEPRPVPAGKRKHHQFAHSLGSDGKGGGSSSLAASLGRTTPSALRSIRHKPSMFAQDPKGDGLNSFEHVLAKAAEDELGHLQFHLDHFLLLVGSRDPALKPYYGMLLTHVGGSPVSNTRDVQSCAEDATSLTLRFRNPPRKINQSKPDYAGWLDKKGEGLIKLYRRRWAEIHGRHLYYSLAPLEKTLGRIDLACASVEIFESDTRFHTFCIAGRGLPRRYELSAETEEERNAWVRALTKTIKQYEAAGAEQLEDWLEGLLPETAVGMNLDNFELEKVVGFGSFAKVIRATLKNTGDPRNEERARWLRETLTAFYKTHRPERISGVDVIVRHSVGQETELHAKLLARYPDASADLEPLLHPPEPLQDDRSQRKVFALKVVKKSALPSIRIARMMMEEKAILQSMKHPYIVRLHYAFQTSHKLFLALTYLPGGDLRTHLNRDKRFTEPRARFYAAQILLALDHLHAHGIVYRDLKPQNVVLDADGHAVLTDLGLATDITQSGGRAYTFCGTPQYVAPEVLEGHGYKKAVDFWALGVMMYEMLVGVTPFQGGDSMQEMFVRVMEESIKYPATRVSPRAKEFISSTLERDPINRLCSLASAKLLKFFKPISWNELRHRRVTAPFIPECDDGEVGIDDRPNTDIAYQNGNISYAATSAADVEKEFAGFSFLGQEVPFIAHRKAEPRNAFSAPQFPLDSGLCSSYEAPHEGFQQAPQQQQQQQQQQHQQQVVAE